MYRFARFGSAYPCERLTPTMSVIPVVSVGNNMLAPSILRSFCDFINVSAQENR